MARQAMGKEARNDFFLYVDEFQNFITPSYVANSCRCKKIPFRINPCALSGYVQQLVKEEMPILQARSFQTPGTRICFRLGDTDAKRFEDGFSFFDAQDLQNLETGEADCCMD